MPGELVGDSVLVADPAEASQIYNKGCFGYPRSGGGLDLDILEAVFLSESGRLEVQERGRTIELERLMSEAILAHRDFEIMYAVYRDLRSRGFVVKTGGEEFNFRVFPRGKTPADSQTKTWVSAVGERALFEIASYLEELDAAARTRKDLHTAVVDEEGDITYYQPSRCDPKGVLTGGLDGPPVKAYLLEDRVLLFDLNDAERLRKAGFYGKLIGRVMHLSLIEAAYLMDQATLEVMTAGMHRKVQVEKLRRKASKFQPDFDLRLRAYSDMRSRGLVVKTGFKYGTHFRVYEGDPDTSHAGWLVHAVMEDHVTTWPDVSRAVRLAHGVKKDMLLARVTPGNVEYLNLKRVRP